METISEQHISVGPEQISLRPDSRWIFQPRYVDSEKTILTAIVRFPDGSLREMEGHRDDNDSPLVRDISLQYSEAEIELFTHRENCMRLKADEMAKNAKEDQAREEHMARLFEAKTEALAIPEVKTAEASITRRIRSAKSKTEVFALVAMVMMQARQ